MSEVLEVDETEQRVTARVDVDGLTTVELRLDEPATELVEAAWARIAAAGICDLLPAAGARPHVSLLVGRSADGDAAVAALDRALAGIPAPRLDFPYIGVFRGEPLVVYLGVSPTPELAALQRLVHDAVAPTLRSVDEHYHPSRIVPHCTLARSVGRDHLLGCLALVRGLTLPTASIVTEATLVDYAPARVRATRPLGA
ncbi:MAG: 2'-5' RNA ligase family protein [Ectothiorhodospiraceae bacterium]|nr:2'-5' RNA ligase family protein [Chromatiales bacterium]MCP5157647.1 2'-5' RNA ligase family protein [Ectothiorhodospiraceae bacterium]